MINILFLGDVFGRPGRELLEDKLPGLIGSKNIDLVIANGENASGGVGLNAEAAQSLFNYGVDVITGGNHIFKFKDLFNELGADPRLIRPANYPPPCPGQGYTVVKTHRGQQVGIGNLIGRVFLGRGVDCPFRTADKIIEDLKTQGVKIIIIDFHAEATSEKRGLGWYLDGRVSALLGTHTHVPTADAHIMPQGTAYQTDVGMCGPHHSVIGMRTQEVLTGFLSGRPQRFEPAKKGGQLNGALLTINAKTGLAENIEALIINQD